MYYKMYSTHS